MPQIKEITVSVPSLVASAKQLTVVMEIDKEALQEELSPLLSGLASLQVAIGSLEVNDADTSQQATDIMTAASTRQKGLQDLINRYKNPLNAAHKVILNWEKATVGVADGIRKQASQKISVYMLEQEKEKKRVEATLARDAARKQQELTAQAGELMDLGHVKEAQRLLTEAEYTMAPELPDLVHKPEGIRATPKFRAACTDTIALLKAIVDGRVSLMQEFEPGEMRPLVEINQVLLNALCKRQGKGLKLPGVVVEEDIQVSRKGVR